MKESFESPALGPERNREEEDMLTQNSIPTESEENVLFGLHEESDQHSKGGSKTESGKLKLLHDGVERCECFPLFTKYISGEVPSVERLFIGLQQHIDTARVAIQEDVTRDDEDGETTGQLKMLNLLSGREQQIRSSIQRYVNSVIRFKQLQKLSMGGSRDLTRQFVDADHARRLAHNNLLESLSIHAKTLDTLVKENVLPRDIALPWSMGQDARTFDARKVIMFSDTVIRNREFVRDWAIVTDFQQQLYALEDFEWLGQIKGRSA